MNVGVVVFPGSNCDHDAYHAAGHVFGQDVKFVWHNLGGTASGWPDEEVQKANQKGERALMALSE